MATPVRCTCSSMYLQWNHDHALQSTFSGFHSRPLNSCYAHQLINEDFPAEWFPMSMIVIFFLGASSFKPRVSAIEISPCSGSAYNVWHSCTMCDNVWHSWTLSFSFQHFLSPSESVHWVLWWPLRGCWQNWSTPEISLSPTFFSSPSSARLPNSPQSEWIYWDCHKRQQEICLILASLEFRLNHN